MTRFLLTAAVCTVLSACAISTNEPPKPDEPIPKESIPAGFSAADCRISEAGGPITETGPGVPHQ
jgi:hypothetical protein